MSGIKVVNRLFYMVTLHPLGKGEYVYGTFKGSGIGDVRFDTESWPSVTPDQGFAHAEVGNTVPAHIEEPYIQAYVSVAGDLHLEVSYRSDNHPAFNIQLVNRLRPPQAAQGR